MEVFVLMFGFEYEGYDDDVKVFASYKDAKAEGDRVMLVKDEDGFGYDYFNIVATNLN
jgi:hypothetical protein